jgi:hypothetical protein
MLDKPYAQQIGAALVVLTGSAFLAFLGWLTSQGRHGLEGIVLWLFFYGLPLAVLFCWLRPYITALAQRLVGRGR